MQKNYFESGARIALYVFAGLLPIWFIPLPVGVEFGREVTFSILIAVSLILWLLSLLTRGEIRYTHSPLLYVGGFFAFVWGLAAFYSRAPGISLFLAPASAERLSTVFLGLLILVLAGAVFRSKADVARALLILFAATGASAIAMFVQLLFGWSFYSLIVSFAGGIDFNPVGTANALSLFYAAVFMTGVGIAFSGILSGAPWWLKYGLGALLFFLFADLLLVNFGTSWIVLLGSAILLWGFLIKDMRGVRVGARHELGIWNLEQTEVSLPKEERLPEQPTANSLEVSLPREERLPVTKEERLPLTKFQAPKFDWRYAGALLLVALSLFMVISRSTIFAVSDLPAEIAPTLRGTWNVSKQVLREGAASALLGSGPGTFGLDWAKYKDPAINQTAFWSLRFNQGFSFAATIFSTAGIFGFLAFALFFGAGLFVSLRILLIHSVREHPLALGVFAGFASLVIGFFLYPGNFTLFLSSFLLLGFLTVLLRKSDLSPEFSNEADESSGSRSWRSWFDATERGVRFETPWGLFLSSLVAILILAGGISFLYFQVGRARASYVLQNAAALLAKGEVNQALRDLDRLIAYDDRNFQNHQAYVQGALIQIQNIIQRAVQGEQVQQEFQEIVARAVQRSRESIELYPEEPSLWRNQGALYEAVIPFIDGAQNASLSSYQKASELDPLNPAIHVDAARAGLVFADRIPPIINQGQVSKDERARLQEVYANTLNQVREELRRALELKPDLASGHFLLTQVALRQGNVAEAITSAEATRALAPLDLGVAFQLGLLYYQGDDLNRARSEFERAVAISENYSNARYFLGLVHSRQGRQAEAIAQFEKIGELNPGNAEVQRILENLRAGRGALENIVPPAPPPEARREEPVKE